MNLNGLISWLSFDQTTIKDFITSNNWFVFGNPSIGTSNAISGNALQLDGHSGLKCTLKLGGQDFTIDGWVYVDSSSPQFARIFNIFSKSTGNPMLILEKPTATSNYFNLWTNSNVSMTSYSGRSSLSSISCIGRRVHFRICFFFSSNIFELYIDGTLAASVTANKYPEQDFDIYVGTGSQELNEDLGIIGSIDELTIYNGVTLNFQNANFTPPTSDYYQSTTIAFDADTARYLVWRYENYGTADLLLTEGSTQTPWDYDVLPVDATIFKSAFYQPTRAKCFDIPATNEIWIKCDIFVASWSVLDRIRIYSDDGNDVNGWCTPSSEITNNYLYWHNGTSIDGGNRILNCYDSEESQRFLLHMKSGTTDGIIEFYFNSPSDSTYRIFTGNVNNGDDFANVYIQMDAYAVLVSNVIISNAPVDISENAKLILNLDFDLKRIAFKNIYCSLDCDTLRNVYWRQLLDNDTRRDVIRTSQLDYDTCRNIQHIVELNCDTVRTMPHKIFLSVIADNPNNLLANSADIIDVPEDNKDLQSFEISINELQLTDVVTFSSVSNFNILEQVTGQFRDYKFNIRIESIQERGILSSCQCCSDIDEILYTQMNYKVPADEQWHWADGSPEVYGVPDSTYKKPENTPPQAEASVHVSHIAAVLSKKCLMRFSNFVSTVDVEAGGVTYNDLIRSIFGWTSRIPHKLINCYLRDDTLFVIQRGCEDNVVDLTGTTFEIVSRDKSLVRTFWGNEVWSKTETKPELIGWRKIYDEDDYKTKISSDGNAEYSYDNEDLVTHTTIHNDDGSTTYIDYQYTTLSKGRKVLESETHSTYIDGNQTDYQQIQHTYLGQGQSHVRAFDEGGEYLGSDIGQSKGDDRVTPWGKYTSRVYQGVYKDKERTIYGLVGFDTSFPVDGDETLKEITREIKWLNRKTMEVVTINLFDFPHVIDFNDRILLEGNEYFLKSNTAIQNNRIVNEQTLSIVRWY